MSQGNRPHITVSWCGYGAHAYAQLTRAVEVAKQGDPLALVTLVVPSNLCGLAARRKLGWDGLAGGPGVAGLQVLTIDRLAELIAAPALSADGRRPTTQPVLAAAWRHALTEAAGSFSQVREHPATVQALIAAHRTLRGVSDEAKQGLQSAGSLTREVLRLHEDVEKHLRADWYDEAELRRRAGMLAPALPSDRLGSVVVFLPQDLDPASNELLRGIATTTPVHVIAALTGAARADQAVRSSVARLIEASLPPQAPSQPRADRVLHASDSDDEVRVVVREVLDELVSGIAAHRIAVLYPNAKPYARLLAEHLAAAGVTINGPGTESTAQRAVPRALLRLLDMAETGMTRAALFGLLAEAPVRDATGNPVPVSRWERMSRDAGVVAAHDWDQRLEHYAEQQRARAKAEEESEDVRGWVVAKHERAALTAEALLSFAVALRDRLQEGQGLSTWTQLSTWARALLLQLFGDLQSGKRRLPPEEQRAADTTLELLSGLEGLDRVVNVASLTALRDTVELRLSDDIPRTGVFGVGVLVAPLSASLGLDLDRVFVVGLSEDLCPGRAREDALLPDAARELAGGELPLVRDRVDRTQRHLLAALATAPRVTASFPRGDLRRSSERLPSRWLLPTLRSLSGNERLAATKWQDLRGDWFVGSASYSRSLLAAPVVANDQQWRVQAHASGAAGIPTDPTLELARTLVAARASDNFTRFDGNLTAHVGELPDFADGERVISPTSLEGWSACPHAYLVQRLLHVEPVEQPEELLTIAANDRGSVIHETLDRFFQESAAAGLVPDFGRPWPQDRHTRLLEIGNVVCDEYERRGASGHPTMWRRERQLILDDLRKALAADDELRAEHGLRQVRSELTFGRKGAPPVEVDLPDGRAAKLSGSADRLDEAIDGMLWVTDYKSGSARTYKAIDEQNPDLAGSKLQLPVYAYAGRAALGRPDAKVRSEYRFIGTKDRGLRKGYELTRAVEERYAYVVQTITDGIRGGVFPANAPEDLSWATWVTCAYCDPDGLGAKERREQWQRKQADPLLKGYLDLVAPAAADLEGDG